MPPFPPDLTPIDLTTMEAPVPIFVVMMTSLVLLRSPMAAAHSGYSQFRNPGGGYQGGRPRAAASSLGPDTPQTYLDLHNAAREEVNVPPLIWDDEVAAYAQRYAEQRRDCVLMHSPSFDYGYGENIYEGSVTNDWSAADAVGFWVGEKPYYDYESNSCTEGQQCLHYTQAVWSETKKVGCARVDCDNGGNFITCNYSPAGNIIGQRPY